MFGEPRRFALLAIVVLLVASACSDPPGGDRRVPRAAPSRAGTTTTTEADDGPTTTGSDAPTTTEATGLDAEPTLRWGSCGAVECATLEVPLDYDDPEGMTIELALVRHSAEGERIGSLLTNPGGPGAAGLFLAEQAEYYFTEPVLESFDIVAWDPRGVGRSTAVDCLDDLDPFWAVDHSPDDEAEVDAILEQARILAEGCEQRDGDLLPHLSSRSTVRDMDLIRVALGEERLSYLGFSYGTYLGTLYAEAYPDKVRALVFDGAVDPALSTWDATIEQAAGFEGALDAFLDDCADDDDCAFTAGGDPQAGYDRLMAQVDAEPLYASVGGEDRELGPGEADLGVAAALYAGRDGWEYLAEALAEAARGDGSALLELADSYTGRSPGGEYTDDLEAFYAIGCVDAPPPADEEELAALAEAAARAAPRFGPSTAWFSAPCVLWPAPSDRAPAPVRAEGAPPILVLGTSNDPATPLRWAETLAAQLDSGVLAVLEEEGHTAYDRGNDCIDEVVEDYLLDLIPPKNGIRCGS